MRSQNISLHEGGFQGVRYLRNTELRLLQWHHLYCRYMHSIETKLWVSSFNSGTFTESGKANVASRAVSEIMI